MAEEMTMEAVIAHEKTMRPKQRKFVVLYVQSGNGAASVRDAGYTVNNPAGHAWKLLSEPKIKKYIEMVQTLSRMENMVSIQMLVSELKDIMVFNPWLTLEERTDAKTKKVTFHTKDLQALKPLGKFIKKYKVNRRTGDIEVEFYDKLDAIEKLMKHTGGYKEDNDQKNAPVSGVAIYIPDNGRNPAKPPNEK